MGLSSPLPFFFFFLLLIIPFSLASDTYHETERGSKLTTFLLLFLLLFFALILVLFLRLCRPVSMAVRSSIATATVQLVHSQAPNPEPAGISKEVINSLPVFQFASLQGGWDAGAECAVCLARFEDSDVLHLLPKCGHAFHMDCVDKWLEGHKSCPVCRQSVEAQDVLSLHSSPDDRNMKQVGSDHGQAAASSFEHSITVS